MWQSIPTTLTTPVLISAIDAIDEQICEKFDELEHHDNSHTHVETESTSKARSKSLSLSKEQYLSNNLIFWQILRYEPYTSRFPG